MAYEVEPTSDRWRDIVNTQNEVSQSRKIRAYIYELEHKVDRQNSKIKELQRENEKFKKQILSLDVVKEAIQEARHEEFDRYNTDWNGYQECT